MAERSDSFVECGACGWEGRMSQANYRDDAHNPDSYHTTCPNCGERDTIFAKERR